MYLPQIHVTVPLAETAGRVLGHHTFCYDPQDLGWSPQDTTVKTLKTYLATTFGIPLSSQRLVATDGLPLPNEFPFLQPTVDPLDYWSCRLQLTVCGGKGGFGSQLRAQGGKMATHKTTNFDACRDLSGHRVGAVKKAESAVAQVQQEAKEEQVQREKVQKRIQKCYQEASAPVKKHRFDNPEFFQESAAIVDSIKQSVHQALQDPKASPTDLTPSESSPQSSSSSGLSPESLPSSSPSSQTANDRPSPNQVLSKKPILSHWDYVPSDMSDSDSENDEESTVTDQELTQPSTVSIP
ncbi:hypothetical protein IWQ62_002271 [Dispira parvispora]|uniref:SDE2-like domain-containing protein n=1 Tax=Dispira parvispora TaxID=1520584 RepID=A0A9W8AWF2_9FUNG|nr:hypothetical protein IWQ62_002271 [Dispira parvispora]